MIFIQIDRVVQTDRVNLLQRLLQIHTGSSFLEPIESVNIALYVKKSNLGMS